MSEIALLKKTMKNQEGHKNEMKKDVDQLNKNLRSKEKELVKLSIKTENMSSNIQSLRFLNGRKKIISWKKVSRKEIMSTINSFFP